MIRPDPTGFATLSGTGRRPFRDPLDVAQPVRRNEIRSRRAG